MKTSEPKKLAWSHKATPHAERAIRELIRLKRKQAKLAERARQLQDEIIKEGGGLACGVRAAIRHQRASRSLRWVTVKKRDFVVLLEPNSGKTLSVGKLP